jgi:urea transporter
MDPGSICAVAGWVALHVAALLSAAFTRIAAGSQMELIAQISFLAAMTAVGLTALFCHQFAPDLATVSGVTLIVMVLTAVLDFTRTYEPATPGQTATLR